MTTGEIAQVQKLGRYYKHSLNKYDWLFVVEKNGGRVES